MSLAGTSTCCRRTTAYASSPRRAVRQRPAVGRGSPRPGAAGGIGLAVGNRVPELLPSGAAPQLTHAVPLVAPAGNGLRLDPLAGRVARRGSAAARRSEEHTSEL